MEEIQRASILGFRKFPTRRKTDDWKRRRACPIGLCGFSQRGFSVGTLVAVRLDAEFGTGQPGLLVVRPPLHARNEKAEEGREDDHPAGHAERQSVVGSEVVHGTCGGKQNNQ